MIGVQTDLVAKKTNLETQETINDNLEGTNDLAPALENYRKQSQVKKHVDLATPNFEDSILELKLSFAGYFEANMV